MRPARFQPWLVDLVDDALPAGVTLTDWAETGVTADADADGTWGLVLTSPAGGDLYIQVVDGSGGHHETRETIIEKTAPAPVPPVDLVPVAGRLRLVNVEGWLAALVSNSGNREIAAVETYSTRPVPSFHRTGLTVRWHSGTGMHLLPWYTLPAGRRRTVDARFNLLEAV